MHTETIYFDITPKTITQYCNDKDTCYDSEGYYRDTEIELKTVLYPRHRCYTTPFIRSYDEMKCKPSQTKFRLSSYHVALSYKNSSLSNEEIYQRLTDKKILFDVCIISTEHIDDEKYSNVYLGRLTKYGKKISYTLSSHFDMDISGVYTACKNRIIKSNDNCYLWIYKLVHSDDFIIRYRKNAVENIEKDFQYELTESKVPDILNV